jgi:hypothetical protein
MRVSHSDQKKIKDNFTANTGIEISISISVSSVLYPTHPTPHSEDVTWSDFAAPDMN